MSPYIISLLVGLGSCLAGVFYMVHFGKASGLTLLKAAGINYGITTVLSLIVCAIAVNTGTTFAEFRDYKIHEVRYYEPWNEEVTYVETETYTDADGNIQTRTVTKTRIDEHGPEYIAVNEIGNKYNIDKEDFVKWKNTWGNNTFVELHRDYYSNDGDMYSSKWTQTFDKMFPWTEITFYENKIRVTNTVLKNWNEVSDSVREYYWRPADEAHLNPIISYDGIKATEYEVLQMRRTNAVLGPKHQSHTLIVLFDAKKHPTMDVTHDMIGAWEGPNMNEIVICIGMDNTKRVIKWIQVYSWLDDTHLHADLRQKIGGMTWYNTLNVSNILLESVPKYWKRKDFEKDFEYLSVDISGWGITIMIFLSLVVSGFASYNLPEML